MINIDPQSDTCLACTNRSSCFDNLSDEELIYSNNHRVQVNFRKRESIIKQGSFANHVFFIKSGLVKIFYEMPSTDSNVVLDLGNKGYIMGLSSLFDNTVYSYSAIAIRDTTVCMIENKIVLELIEKNGKFATELIKTITASNDYVIKKLISLTGKSLPARLADTMIYLSEEVYKSINFKSYLTRHDFAEMSGMSDASFTAVLKDFKTSNIIRINDGFYEILEMSKLRDISSNG